MIKHNRKLKLDQSLFVIPSLDAWIDFVCIILVILFWFFFEGNCRGWIAVLRS